MDRMIRRVFKVTTSAVFVAGLTGCIMHAMMPQAHPPQASEFGMGPRRSTTGAYSGQLIADEKLVTKRLQTVRVAVLDSAGRPVDDATITVDGGMPAHGHGLPTRPRVTRCLGDGVYEVEGLRFNMGGWWELKLYVDAGMGSDTITFNLSL